MWTLRGREKREVARKRMGEGGKGDGGLVRGSGALESMVGRSSGRREEDGRGAEKGSRRGGGGGRGRERMKKRRRHVWGNQKGKRKRESETTVRMG